MRTIETLEILIDDKDEGEENSTLTIEVPQKISVYDLKRTILYANGNKPFFLEFNISNSSMLSDLQQLIQSHHGKKANLNQIKIYEKMDEFNLTIMN